MPGTRTLRLLTLAGAFLAMTGSIARADQKPPTVAITPPDAKPRVERPLRPTGAHSTSEPTGGWWLGSVAMVAVLAVVGGLSLASKRFLPQRDGGGFQVVGRSSLSPRHSVYLLRVGDRILIVGTGPQGAPSTLGEVTDPAELARLMPGRPARSSPSPMTPARPSASSRKSTGFDQRIGDDE